MDEVAAIRSDHLACVTNFQPVNPLPPIIRWDFKDMDWSNWESNLEDAVQRWYNHIVDTTDDVNLLCDSFTQAVNNCAKEHLPTKSVSRHSRPFFTPELKSLQDKLRDARRSFRYRSDQQNLNRLNQARDKYNEAYNRARTAWWSKTLEKIDHKNLWKVVNKIKNSHAHVAVQPIRTTNGEYFFHDEDIASQLEEVHIHRSHAVNPSFDDDWKEQVEKEVTEIIHRESIRIHDDQYIPNEYNIDIKTSEVISALRSCNSSASPGPDKILPIMLTKAEGAASISLQFLYNSCWKDGSIPSAWKMDNRIYMPKPGKPDYNIPKAYRPLSLNRSVGKLYEDIVCARFV